MTTILDRTTRRLAIAPLAAAALILAACATEPADQEAEIALTLDNGLPTLAGLEDGWNTVDPEDGTTCSDGSDYRFFVRKANPAHLVVYFQGGGACWSGATCDVEGQPSFRPVIGDTDPSTMSGIFALDNPENPFADYSMVYVPYCTGDVHLGDTTASYVAPPLEATEEREARGEKEIEIAHKGHHNAMVVLDWTDDVFTAPEAIFVTGSSAGSIPSPYWAAHLADRYPEARIAQLGDGAGGYRRDASESRPHEQWATLDAIDALEPFQAIGDEQFDYEELYVTAARAHPDVMFAEYDTAEDSVQLRFLALGGGDVDSLLPLLDANQADIRAAVDNFRSYVAGGDVHTILARPEFYTYSTNGARLRDWVAKLAAGEPVENVRCEDCSLPEMVDGAAEPATGP